MKLINTQLILLVGILALFTACENSGITSDEPTTRIYSLSEVEILTRIDIKAGDEVDTDPIPIESWVFPVDPWNEVEVDEDAFVSVGVTEGCVDEPMDITVDLYHYYGSGGLYFEFGPHGYVFQESIEVATAPSYWNIPPDADEDDLSFMWVIENNPDIPEDDELIPIPTSLSEELLIGEFEHFSKYAVGVIPGGN